MILSLKKAIVLGLIVSSAVLSGCAANNAEEQAAQTNEQQAYPGDPNDPLEPVNRLVWDFNWDILDAYIVRPVTVGYTTVMPGFARTGLLNAARNLEEPTNAINNLLQGKVGGSLDSVARFVINSTVGLLGTIDVAENIGLPRQRESLGETLGTYGVGTGPFIMLPGAGPSDARSLTGNVVEAVYYPLSLGSGAGIPALIVTTLETRAALMGQEAQIEQSVDDYAFIKNAYFQNLEFRVTDGKSADEIDESEFEDFEDFEDSFDDFENLDDDPPKQK